jgi:putative aminopeptidase FrvX
MSITIDDRMIAPMDQLVSIGFAIKQIYTDGAVQMAQIGGPVRVFVRPDGSVTPPATTETMIVSASMHGMGMQVTVKPIEPTEE